MARRTKGALAKQALPQDLEDSPQMGFAVTLPRPAYHLALRLFVLRSWFVRFAILVPGGPSHLGGESGDRMRRQGSRILAVCFPTRRVGGLGSSGDWEEGSSQGHSCAIPGPSCLVPVTPKLNKTPGPNDLGPQEERA